MITLILLAFVQFPLYFVSLFHIRSVGYKLLHVIEISRWWQLLKVYGNQSGFCIEFLELVLGSWWISVFTLQKFWICDEINCLEKRFKICHILYTYTKIQSCLFWFFISCYFIFPPNECPGLCSHRPGHSLGKKIKYIARNEKYNFGFSYL